MKLGLVVNDPKTEKARYTTTELALAAGQAGHEVWTIPVEGFTLRPDGRLVVHGRAAAAQHTEGSTYLADLNGPGARTARFDVTELDALLLRNNPADDEHGRAWIRSTVVHFGRLAKERGVVVLNDPDGLARARDKSYLLAFPDEVRPRTLVTYSTEEIRAFRDEIGRAVVIKPVAGSGGRNVFLLRPDDRANLNQIISTVQTEGFVMVQEYLPEATRGDVRLFLLEGEPLRVDGHLAAFRREPREEDLRSNMAAGGRSLAVQVTHDVLRTAAAMRDRLVADGMFLVALDLVGNKVLEINVYSPGGLWSISRYEGVRFADAIIRALEKRCGATR